MMQLRNWVTNLQVEQLGQICVSSLENIKVNNSLNPIPSVPFNSFLFIPSVLYFAFYCGMHCICVCALPSVLVTQ